MKEKIITIERNPVDHVSDVVSGHTFDEKQSEKHNVLVPKFRTPTESNVN